MADVEFNKVGNSEDMMDIFVVDSVPGVDIQSGRMGQFRGPDETGKFDLTVRTKAVCESSGVQLDEVPSKLCCCRNLRLLGVNEKTYDDPSLLEAGNRWTQRGLLRRTIEPAFRCYFLAVFRDQADILRQDAQGKLDNFR
jgi:hypothetical protein